MLQRLSRWPCSTRGVGALAAVKMYAALDGATAKRVAMEAKRQGRHVGRAGQSRGAALAVVVSCRMDVNEAIALIRDAVGAGGRPGVWADLGAGTGTFTRALTRILDEGSTIYAVDHDASSIAALHALSASSRTQIVPVRADFARAPDLPELGDAQLDGILLANSLHFVRDAERVLTALAHRVRDGGHVVIVEYDRRARSRWVPYPIEAARWPALAKAAGLSSPAVTATLPSVYAGMLYAAVATRA